jgi:glycosyltransferase involved in cell wall biosynthesis
MKKKRILAISPDNYGVGKFRILDPYKYISENYKDEFHVDITFEAQNNNDYMKNYDIVIFHSFIHKTSHEHNIDRIKWLKNQGIKVIMDIDDLWSVPSHHPYYLNIKENNMASKKIEMLKLVDYVTSTTPIFQNTIKDKLKLKNLLIFPNAVDNEDPQFKPNPIESDKIRFGYLGGSTHLLDIDKMKGGIVDVLSEYKTTSQFVLCGFDLRGNMTEIDQFGNKKVRPLLPSESTWVKYEKIFTDDYKYLSEDYKKHLFLFKEIDYDDKNESYIRRWTKNINEYAFNYNYFDISLSPLLENDFNYNKSQLKVIEAGFHKKAIIASEFGPYTIDLKNSMENGVFNSNGNALLVPQRKDHKLWGYYMKKLITNPNMVSDLGEKLYETVKDKYSLKNVSQNRVNFLQTI